MQPQRFETIHQQVANEEWKLEFVGRTDVTEQETATGGLQIALFRNKNYRVRVIAADTAPESTAVSDHVVERVSTCRHELGQTEYVDAMPVEQFQQFEGATVQRVLEMHEQMKEELGDISAEEAGFYGFDLEAVALSTVDGNNSMQVRNGPTVLFDITRDPNS